MNLELIHWKLQKVDADAIEAPQELDDDWLNTSVPGTVASHFKAQGLTPPSDLDDFDWWYTAQTEVSAETHIQTVFHGLSPFAEIWLNGTRVAECHSMFMPVHVTALLQAGTNTWHLCFRSMSKKLKEKKPRPKWKTPLIDQQNLRWIRTTLIGRMVGWNLPIPVIGPWGEIGCEAVPEVQLNDIRLTTAFDPNDNLGSLRLSGVILTEKQRPVSASLKVGGHTVDVDVTQQDDGRTWTLSANAVLQKIAPWWPHTHGEPRLYECTLNIQCENSSLLAFDLGKTGFKSVALDREKGANRFSINGVPVFCRGSVWTPQDVLGFSNDRTRLEKSLTLAAKAGVNMFRVNGTMNYESDDFFQLCDELGIMIWQDFMFANMDYPMDEEGFASNVNEEIRYQLTKMAKHVCVTAYCGSNEAYMQAAMMGIPEDVYRNPLFEEILPRLCEQLHPGIPFMEGSPYGGKLHFLPDTGTSHYYGVSAYMQPLSDAETSQVKFASECLAFSHIPETHILEEMFQGKLPYTHDPIWKQGVPRMGSAGWDFEDVRDFYLQSVYGIEPIALRYKDTPRYLEISRVLTGAIISETIALWRSHYTQNMGALTWFWQDLHAGAGWGLLDHTSYPKAAWYHFKRSSQAITIALISRGMNGLVANVVNDTNQSKKFRLEIKGFNPTDTLTIDTSAELNVEKFSQETIQIDTLLGYFTDLPHTFRFGPIQHRVIQARLYDLETDSLISEDFFFPEKVILPKQKHPEFKVEVEKLEETKYKLTLSSSSLLQWVRLNIPRCVFSDNYFHLAPNQETVVLAESDGGGKFKGYIEAVNLFDEVRVSCK